MRRILSCFLLTVLLATISHTASAIVGDSGTSYTCADYTTPETCNSSTVGCWWNVWGNTPSCVTCTNTVPYGAVKTTVARSVAQPVVSDFTSNWVAKRDGALAFCPYEITCNAGYYPAKTTGSSGSFICHQCSGYATPATQTTILVTGTTVLDLYRKYGNSLTASYTKCYQCGDNAIPNDAHTNCNCLDGFAANSAGTLISGVGGTDCSYPAIYTITVCDKNGCDDYPDTLYYQYGVGYDRSTTGTFDGSDLIYDEGSTGGSIWENKKNLVGWALKQGATNSDLFFTGNTLSATNHAKNIIDYCDTNTCEYDSYGGIKLYPVFAPKEYQFACSTATPSGGSCSWTSWYTHGFCKYGQDCVFHAPTADKCDGGFVPVDGKYISHWICDDCANANKIVRDGDVILEPDTEYDGNNVTLTAVYADCPTGTYSVTDTFGCVACPESSSLYTDATLSTLARGTVASGAGTSESMCYLKPGEYYSVSGRVRITDNLCSY